MHDLTIKSDTGQHSQLFPSILHSKTVLPHSTTVLHSSISGNFDPSEKYLGFAPPADSEGNANIPHKLPSPFRLLLFASSFSAFLLSCFSSFPAFLLLDLRGLPVLVLSPLFIFSVGLNTGDFDLESGVKNPRIFFIVSEGLLFLQRKVRFKDL